MGHGMGGATTSEGLHGPRGGVLRDDFGSVCAGYGVEALPRLSNGECAAVVFVERVDRFVTIKPPVL